ncbi:MAG: PKD domain-containing protein, partial [Candidatus Altiarchaeota archaeon]|nr:PKD domain-containing protein [Candidatus Altiarchaeota archaeon]
MEPKPERLRLIGARSNPAGVDSALKFGGRSHPRILHIIAVALLLAGILASPASAKTSAECGGGFVNGSTGGPGGTPLPYSTCSDDAACMNDWTCAESEPTKVYVKSTNSFCMTDLNPERCCWEYIELLTCPGGAACQRPSIPTVYDPYNRVSAWCGCAFTVDVTATIDADTVTFTAVPYDECGISPYTYLWVFEDAQTSTAQNPVYTYPAAGDYTVTLTVTDAAPDPDTTHVSQNVIISEVGPPADFEVELTYTPENPDPGQEVTFTAKAGGGAACKPYGYVFDFGDGSATESVTGEAGDAGSWEEKPVT